MICGPSRALLAALLASLSVAVAAQDTATISLRPGQAQIGKAHGHLASLSAWDRELARDCVDEYWFEGDGEEAVARSSEEADEVASVARDGERVTLECRNTDLGLEVTKTYAPGPVPGTLRKTVALKPFSRRGILHVMSRVKVGGALAALEPVIQLPASLKQRLRR